MRLIDLVSQASPTETLLMPDDRRAILNGPGALSPSIVACKNRYVLDRPTSLQCLHLVCSPSGLPDPGEPTLALPHDNFWLESFTLNDPANPADTASLRRMGLLVSCDGPQSGEIQCFFEQTDGSPGLLGGVIKFDFEVPMPPTDDRRHFRMQHPGLPHLASLLEHVSLELRPDWASYARAFGPSFRGLVATQAELAWTAVPLLISFSLLLGSREMVRKTYTDRSAINVARAKKGKVALLDHMEISLNLNRTVSDGSVMTGHGSSRSTPRLHFVRGHLVERSGKRFWRSSHLRGIGDEPLTRTVHVRSSYSLTKRGRILTPYRREAGSEVMARRLPKSSQPGQRDSQLIAPE